MGMIYSMRVTAWLLVVAVFVMTVGPIGLRPVTDLPPNAERVIAYLVVGGAFGMGYASRPLRSILVVVGCAALFELAQHLAPGRHGVFLDFVFKGSAGMLGVLAGSYLARMLEIAKRR